MLHEAQLKEEGISVMYTPYSGDPTAEHVSQAAEAFMMQNAAFTDFIYTGMFQLHIWKKDFSSVN